jgi:hypothetical protein
VAIYKISSGLVYFFLSTCSSCSYLFACFILQFEVLYEVTFSNILVLGVCVVEFLFVGQPHQITNKQRSRHFATLDDWSFSCPVLCLSCPVHILSVAKVRKKVLDHLQPFSMRRASIWVCVYTIEVGRCSKLVLKRIFCSTARHIYGLLR